MTVSQRDRHDLFARLESTLGESAATNLMELLPLQPNDELATRSDMAALRDTVRGEISEVRGEIAEVRGEISQLRGELKGDMASLDGRLSREMGRLYRWGAAIVAANAVSTVTVLLAG